MLLTCLYKTCTVRLCPANYSFVFVFMVRRLRCACSRFGTSPGRALQPFSNRSVNSKVAFQQAHNILPPTSSFHHFCCFYFREAVYNYQAYIYIFFNLLCQENTENNLGSADGIRITNKHSNNHSDCIFFFCLDTASGNFCTLQQQLDNILYNCVLLFMFICLQDKTIYFFY